MGEVGVEMVGGIKRVTQAAYVLCVYNRQLAKVKKCSVLGNVAVHTVQTRYAPPIWYVLHLT